MWKIKKVYVNKRISAERKKGKFSVLIIVIKIKIQMIHRVQIYCYIDLKVLPSAKIRTPSRLTNDSLNPFEYLSQDKNSGKVILNTFSRIVPRVSIRFP